MADDLQRFLEDRPIRARRPTLWRRLAKWSRRHLTLVAASAVLTVIALVAGAAFQLRELRLRDVARTAAEAALEKADQLQPKERYEEELGVLTAVDGQLEGRGLAALHERVRQRLRDVMMLMRLDQAEGRGTERIEKEWTDYGEVERAYSRAFSQYGIDPRILGPREAARRVRESAIRDRLIAGLERWSNCWAKYKVIRETADLADDNLWRRRLRAAAAQHDRKSLQAMADEEGVLDRSASDLEAFAGVWMQGMEFSMEPTWTPTVERLLLAAHQQAPDNFRLNEYLSFSFLVLKRPPDPVRAARFAQAAVALQPGNARSWNLLAGALSAQGNLPEATAAYRRLSALKRDVLRTRDNDVSGAHPSEVISHLVELGTILSEQGKLAEAVQVCRDALAILKTLRESSFRHDAARSGITIAALLRQAGRAHEAEEVFKQVLVDCNMLIGYMNQLHELAWYLATDDGPQARIRNRSWAVEVAKLAVQARSGHEDSSAWKALGVAQYRAGDWKSAVATLDKSMTLGSPDVVTISFYLALAHWRLGEKEQARRCYDQARQQMDKNRPEDAALPRLRSEAAALLGI
jgi:tetratricopeptide (TPR) repeat protein